MKKAKRHIIYSWIVLICFIAGQTIVFAHTHPGNTFGSTTHKTSQQTITEKCQLCDAMHHNSMVINEHHYFIPVIAVDHIYKQGQYDFISIALILSQGRAPPSLS